MKNQILKDWHEDKFENLLDLIIDHRGKTPKKLGSDWQKDGVPTLSAKNIKDGKIVNDQDIKYVSEKLYQKWMPEKLESDDILLTSEAPLGELFFLKKKADYVLSQRLFALRTNKGKLFPKYLYYYLKSPIGIHELQRRISGTAAQGIRQAELRKIKVVFPIKVSMQQKIASVLTAFDDKIEVNTKIAKTLEEMAQAIFKEWFVKFRFPGHEKVKMVDSELGKIPEGWTIKRIKDTGKINKGLSYSSKDITDNEEDTPLINLANFQRGGGFNSSGIKYYKGKYKSSNIVNPGDIIIALTDLTSNREIIGHPARVPSYSKWNKIIISLDVCSLEIEPILTEFLYYLMLRKNFSYLMASSAGGTNVAHLSLKFIENYQFVLPTIPVLKKFQAVISPMYRKINHIEIENQKLAEMRDLLLPKLVKGEMRV